MIQVYSGEDAFALFLQSIERARNETAPKNKDEEVEIYLSALLVGFLNRTHMNKTRAWAEVYTDERIRRINAGSRNQAYHILRYTGDLITFETGFLQHIPEPLSESWRIDTARSCYDRASAHNESLGGARIILEKMAELLPDYVPVLRKARTNLEEIVQ